MYEIADNVIKEYGERLNLKQPIFDTEFKKLSYSKWAVEELRMRILNESLKLPPHISITQKKEPVEVITDFIDEMEDYSELNSDAKIIFQIAKEIGIEIFYLFA